MTEPGQPAIVPAEVIAELQARTSPRRIVDDPLWAAPRWSRGQRVTVVEGPLAGLQGVCGKNAGERINVLFDLFSRPMMADFAPHDLVEAPG
jgi:transcription antitermination factor NusG